MFLRFQFLWQKIRTIGSQFHRFGITALTVAVNKGLELLRDPERGGVAAVGVVFSSLRTDLRISESWLNSNYKLTTKVDTNCFLR